MIGAALLSGLVVAAVLVAIDRGPAPTASALGTVTNAHEFLSSATASWQRYAINQGAQPAKDARCHYQLDPGTGQLTGLLACGEATLGSPGRRAVWTTYRFAIVSTNLTEPASTRGTARLTGLLLDVAATTEPDHLAP